ncbi:DUF1642 domain-containing protein [Streptococcus koreensis]|uniref:DUF1642 domain-containing protein n=1 Tax=Streptococcus koreensis TaxID=2382163 RepID=UPI0022E364AE|nr:DUF1642 domain-containing protein [Streptococcus koreensis]
MKKQELIEKINAIPWDEGLVVDTLKINRAGLLQLIEQLDEPQKVQVPEFVADWIDNMKCQGKTLYYGLDHTPPEEVDLWFCEDEVNRQNTFARAWLDGYTVEEEKRYLVKVKNIGDGWEYLKWNSVQQYWYFGNKKRLDDVRLYHTLENLQKGGFGNVFVNPLFTIEEVEG